MTASDSIPLSDACSVTLHRTLRIPDEGGEYPLPPSLGAMEIHRVDEGEFVVPMRRAEALWLSFGAPWWKPHVLKVGIGGIDAISGKTFSSQTLMTDPQDYVVVPNQPWLDGIQRRRWIHPSVRGRPAGRGTHCRGAAHRHRGTRRSHPLDVRPSSGPVPGGAAGEGDAVDGRHGGRKPPTHGIGSGGRMRQEIYADEYGLDSWEP